MALNFQPTLGFVLHGNFVDNIEAKGIFCKTLDVDGNVDIDGNLIVTGTFTPSGPATFVNLTVAGNTILGDAALDTLLVNATSNFVGPATFANLTVTGNTILGDASTDTLLVGATATFTAPLITMNTGAAIVDHNLTLVRTNDTVANNINFLTAAANDWTITTGAGIHTLAFVQGAGALNQNITMGLGTGALLVTGLVSATLGFTTPATGVTAGYRHTGTLTAIGAAPTVVLSTHVGTVTFTATPDMAAGATTTVNITNTQVSAATVGQVVLQTTTAAATSTPRIETVTYGAGTIAIALRNSGAVATGVATYQISFILFN